MFPSHAGGMQFPRPMAILWETTSRHIERPIRHDDVARQIIKKELESALDLWTCTSWQDLVDEGALRSWEESRENMFLPSETGQKQPLVQDESVGITSEHFW